MKSIPNTIIAAILAVVLTAFVGICLQTPFGQGLENWVSDKMQTWRYELTSGNPKYAPDSRLVLARIDQEAVSDLGRWPFPRSTHGQFLELLAPEKPKVATFDIFFTEYTAPSLKDQDATPGEAPAPTVTSDTNAPAATAPALEPAARKADAKEPTQEDTEAAAPIKLEPDDEALAEGAKLLPHVITVAARDPKIGSKMLNDASNLPTRPIANVIGDKSAIYSSPYAVRPIEPLRKVSYFGFADADANDFRRLIPLVVSVNGKFFASLDLETLIHYWDVDPDKVVVTLGHDVALQKPDGFIVRIPINNKGEFLVNYRAQTDDFQWESYGKMGKDLADLANGAVKERPKTLPELKDKIVVFGVDLAGNDSGPIPINAYSPLVTAHLNVLNNVLQQDYLHTLPLWVLLPIYALFVYVLGNLMLRLGVLPMIGIASAAIALYFASAFLALLVGNLLVPTAMPVIGLLLLTIAVPSKGFFGEEREKRRVKAAMSAHLSEKVMHHILAHPDNVKLGGQKVEITVMFCDIRGFTKYCDNRDSSEVMDVLNDYMEEMTKVVHKYDGTVDKYIGDCIMAFWNAPAPQPDHAQRAVCCAMEMRYALAEFKTKRAGLDIELFECGIGVHTGEALVGNMGSSFKRSYTAMGSTVNMGARLEALTKRLNERILISEDTKKQLQGDFPLTDRGEATVPGFATPVHVYAVGADQDISSALKVGRTLATKQEYTAEEVTAPIWKPAPLPEDADPNP